MQESFYAFLTLGLLSEIKGKAGLESGTRIIFQCAGATDSHDVNRLSRSNSMFQ